MKVLSYRPSNSWLQRQLDERWRAWLTRCCAGAAVVGVALGALVGPRQQNVRLRYEIAQQGASVAELERSRRRLLLEREALTSPGSLARELPELGLVPVTRERVAYLTADGRIVAAPTRPPRPVRPAQEPR